MKPDYVAIAPVAGGTKNVAYTGTAGTTAALSDQCAFAWVVTTTNAFVRVNATATTADMYLPAYVPVCLSVPPGSTVSGIQVTTGGTLYATPLA